MLIALVSIKGWRERVLKYISVFYGGYGFSHKFLNSSV